MESRHFVYRPRLRGIASILSFLAAIWIAALSGSEPHFSWIRHVIDPADPAVHRSGADGVKLGDLNRDGRPDLVTGWEEGGKVRVCIHPGPEKVREPWPAVTVGKVPSPEDAIFADLDGDGRLDVVSACEGKERRLHVHWGPTADENLMDESKWTTATFSQAELEQSWMQLLPRDLDDDGDLDLFVGSKGADGSVMWLRNPGPELARDLAKWSAARIADAGWIMSLEVLPTIEGDCLVHSDRKGEGSGIWLAPFLSEAPWIAEPKRIAAAGEEVMFLDLADVDRDGRDDVVAAIRPQRIQTFLQPESTGGIWVDAIPLEQIPAETFGSVKAVEYAKLDPKGLPGFFVTCENASGSKSGVLFAGTLSSFTSISGEEGVKFDRIELIDLDGDGDLDVITCEERANLGVIWYENRAIGKFNMGKTF